MGIGSPGTGVPDDCRLSLVLQTEPEFSGEQPINTLLSASARIWSTFVLVPG